MHFSNAEAGKSNVGNDVEYSLDTLEHASDARQCWVIGQKVRHQQNAAEYIVSTA